MAVGFPADKPAIDARAGDLARRVRDVLTDIERFQAFLAGKADADLIELGYTQDDVNLLKAAILALDALRLVALGQRTVPTADNFTFQSNKLLGPN